jgi:hypothetical protein
MKSYIKLDEILFVTFLDQNRHLVEVRVRPQRPLRDELLAAGGALLVAGPQGRHDALGAESAET